jgi:hypothetical protein
MRQIGTVNVSELSIVNTVAWLKQHAYGCLAQCVVLTIY